MADFEQTLRDGVGELLLQIASGEITVEDAERELDIWKALTELIVVRIEIEQRDGPTTSPEVRMQRDQEMLARWQEACRRADVPPIELPADLVQGLVRVAGRPQ